MEASAAGPAHPVETKAATPLKVHLALTVVIVVGLFVQVYLAGRGVFGAGSYEAHEVVGGILHLVPMLLIVSAAVGPATRNRQDVGMAVVLLVLYTVQVMIANRDYPGIAAFHPVNALLMVGLSFGILGRTRARLAGREV